ncbi:hypothetical protein SDC9_202331 [bioreactor metagenome]|uniref:Uncharacterized protein n=1 Tax=bioreactor metagenome TaxID=1076179 RepID=A0A645IW57_9ZZZZ
MRYGRRIFHQAAQGSLICAKPHPAAGFRVLQRRLHAGGSSSGHQNLFTLFGKAGPGRSFSADGRIERTGDLFSLQDFFDTAVAGDTLSVFFSGHDLAAEFTVHEKRPAAPDKIRTAAVQDFFGDFRAVDPVTRDDRYFDGPFHLSGQKSEPSLRHVHRYLRDP